LENGILKFQNVFIISFLFNQTSQKPLARASYIESAQGNDSQMEAHYSDNNQFSSIKMYPYYYLIHARLIDVRLYNHTTSLKFFMMKYIIIEIVLSTNLQQ